MKRISFAAWAAALVFCTGAFIDAHAQFGRTMPKIRESARISSSDANSEGRTPEASGSVIMSQVYGGGGGATGTYLHDYVELKNVSTSPKSIGGLTLMYGSSTGQFASSGVNSFALPNVTIQPGKYYLVELSPAGTAGAALPTPDAVTTNLSMSGTNGKVALVAGLTPNSCGATATPCALPHVQIVDVVSWGASNNAEGGAPTNGGAALTATQGNVRKNGGCTDTDNNNADFDIISAPVPRNSATAAAPCGIVTITRTPLDMDGDGRTDFVVLRDSNGATAGGFVDWYVSLNSSSASYQVRWGIYDVVTEDLAPADYDGDGKTDIAVFRRGASLGTFYIIRSADNTIDQDQLGLSTDQPISGDYSGDGKADTAVYRNNGNGTSNFYYRQNTSVNYSTLNLPAAGSPLVGDYNGDGTADPATFSNDGVGGGRFNILLSGAPTFVATNFGQATDMAAPGDYDGDGKSDICVIRNVGGTYTWEFKRSIDGAVVSDSWGLAASDSPTPGDYNGDGKWDYGVWRGNAQGEFFIMTPVTRNIFQRQWGLAGDFPVAFHAVANT